MHRLFNFLSPFMLASCLAITTSSPALAVSSLQSPNVHKGEFEIEYSGSTTFDGNPGQDGETEHEIEFEYGLTDRISLELEGEIVSEPGEPTIYEGTGFGATFQFFEQGENWVDTGLELTYGFAAHDGDADTIAAQLLLEKQTGNLVHLANFRLRQEIGEDASGGLSQRLLWNSRYLYSQYFEPGIELQSNFGRTNENRSFDEQEHFIGPAAYGRVADHWKYEVAYYRGISNSAPDNAARIKLEYEFYF